MSSKGMSKKLSPAGLLAIVAVVAVSGIVVATVLLSSNVVNFKQGVNSTNAIELQSIANPPDIYGGNDAGSVSAVTINGYLPSSLTGASVNFTIRESGYSPISAADILSSTFTFNGQTIALTFVPANDDGTILYAIAGIPGTLPASSLDGSGSPQNLFTGTLNLQFVDPGTTYMSNLYIISAYMTGTVA